MTSLSKNNETMISGDMGVHRVPEEARDIPEDRTMDDQIEPERGGHGDAETHAGRHAGCWTTGTSGTHAG